MKSTLNGRPTPYKILLNEKEMSNVLEFDTSRGYVTVREWDGYKEHKITRFGEVRIRT